MPLAVLPSKMMKLRTRVTSATCGSRATAVGSMVTPRAPTPSSLMLFTSGGRSAATRRG